MMFTGRSSSEDTPNERTVLSQHVESHLFAARHLLNAIGRSQVEFAAAALAIMRVEPLAPVLPILQQVDPELRVLARSAVMGEKSFHR